MLYIDPEKESQMKSSILDDNFGFNTGPYKDEIKDDRSRKNY